MCQLLLIGILFLGLLKMSERSREEETLKGGREGRFWKGRRKEEMGAGMSNCRENREDVMAFIE